MRSPPLPPKRILFVDDDVSVRSSMSMILQFDGHHVVTAENGAEGLVRFAAGNFDLVITDHCMPGMTGAEFATAIKQLAPELPVLMLTAFPPSVVPPSVDIILTKPFTIPQLRQSIHHLTAPRPVAEPSP